MVSDRSRASRCTSVASFYKIRIACFQIDICCLFFVFFCFFVQIKIPCFQVGSRCLNFFFSRIRVEYMFDAIYCVQDQDFVHA
jgi:hypothetical protein